MMLRWLILGAFSLMASLAAAQDEPGAEPSHPAAAALAAIEAWREVRAQPLAQLDPGNLDSRFSDLHADTNEVLQGIDLSLGRLAGLLEPPEVDPAALAAMAVELDTQMQSIVEIQGRLSKLETERREERFANRPRPEDADPVIGAVAWLTRDPQTWEAWRALDALANGDAEQRERAEALAERAEAARKARVALVHVTRGEQLAVRREEVNTEMRAAIAAIIEADPRSQLPPGTAANEAVARATPTAVPTLIPEIDTSAFRRDVHLAREALKSVSFELYRLRESPS